MNECGVFRIAPSATGAREGLKRKVSKQTRSPVAQPRRSYNPNIGTGGREAIRFSRHNWLVTLKAWDVWEIFFT